ncbi:MAG: DMT family transporter [Pseudomonadota bacterium]
MSDTIKAAIWMSGAILSFSAMAVAGREVSFELDTFEIMTIRSLIGVIIVGTIAILWRKTAEIKTQRLGTHLVRNLFHFTGQNLWFYALPLIPLAQLFAFEFSTPIWIILAAPFLLGERLTRPQAMAVAFGFIGILIVTRPWIAGISPGIIPAALCAVGFAGAAIFTKRLTTTESILNIMFWLTFLQLIFGIIASGYDLDFAMPSAQSWPWLIVIAIGGLVAHTSITKALTLAPATVVTPVDFCRLPVIIAIGYFLYSEAVDIFVLIGAVLIFGANYANIWMETRKKRVASAD